MTIVRHFARHMQLGGGKRDHCKGQDNRVRGVLELGKVNCLGVLEEGVVRRQRSRTRGKNERLGKKSTEAGNRENDEVERPPKPPSKLRAGHLLSTSSSRLKRQGSKGRVFLPW